ncbi:MAG TPA: hypothetical protein VMR54_08330 [Thermoanaerobaculia bacterium]|nr:hypothetical protein [Thermoanaerobaculia bacterium]
MSVESLHGVMGPHARRLVDASVEARGFAVAAALSAAALRAVGAEAISLDGRTIDLARFLLAAIVPMGKSFRGRDAKPD